METALEVLQLVLKLHLLTLALSIGPKPHAAHDLLYAHSTCIQLLPQVQVKVALPMNKVAMLDEYSHFPPSIVAAKHEIHDEFWIQLVTPNGKRSDQCAL